MVITPLNRVTTALDRLIESASAYHGLIPSMLDRRTGKMLMDAPPLIPGQRPGDRAYQGSNLIHDESTLATLYALAAHTGDAAYRQAADAYLERFANHCTGTVSGLFPWGEHAYWHLIEDRLGSSYHEARMEYNGPAIHDHLRACPRWLWEKLWAINPECVTRFGEGIDNHWTQPSPTDPTARQEYIRHGAIDEITRHPYGKRACDFPRHGGFYVFDLAFAATRSGRSDLFEQMTRFGDYWWPMRDEHGMCMIESRAPDSMDRFHGVNAPGQTLSLGVSLLEAADLLEADHAELAATYRQRAAAYIDGFLAAPHDLAAGLFVLLCKRGSAEIVDTCPVWGSKYGQWPASYVALNAMRGVELTGYKGLLDYAIATGRAYLETPYPDGVQAPAMDTGLALGLLAQLYVTTRESRWLEGGLQLADRIAPLYFDDAPLPRSAVGIDHYESQMGPGFLLHGLARLALLAETGPDQCPLEADYTAR